MSLLLSFCLMQVFGNIAQGPANALLADHVPAHRRGAAAGALTLARSIGAGIAVVGTRRNGSNGKNGLQRLDPQSQAAAAPEDRAPAPASDFMWFLVAFTIATGTMSVLSRFALFYLQDVIGLVTPARGALILSVSVGGGVALAVLPAGIVSDRVGRFPLLLAGGILGSISVAT